MVFSLLAAAAVTTGQVQHLSTPLPVLLPAPSQGTGYYIMQGTTIVSQPYATASDCFKALSRAKSALPPGSNTATLVCAHRAP
jgi:hypothetical protein